MSTFSIVLEQESIIFRSFLSTSKLVIDSETLLEGGSGLRTLIDPFLPVMIVGNIWYILEPTNGNHMIFQGQGVVSNGPGSFRLGVSLSTSLKDYRYGEKKNQSSRT